MNQELATNKFQVGSSTPSILLPWFESQAHHLCLYHYSQFVLYLSCERTKINKKRPDLAHFYKTNFKISLCKAQQEPISDFSVIILPNLYLVPVELLSFESKPRHHLTPPPTYRSKSRHKKFDRFIIFSWKRE